MRVLIIRISPGTIGGAELSAFDQAVALKELGHEPIFATNLRPLMKRAAEEGIKTAWFPWINRGPGKLRILIFFLLLPTTYLLAPLLALLTRPDLINPHSREDQNAFTHSKWLHRRPVVWKDPGDLRVQLHPERDSFGKRIHRRNQIDAINKADHIYVLNEGDRQMLAETIGEHILQKTSAIPASIIYRYYDRQAPAHEKPTGKLVVGTLCRAERNKGLDYLIDAIRRQGCDDNVEYWLVNDGAYKQELQAKAADLPCIKFLPYATDISSYLNTFDVLVHPAEIEGWGRIIKEAMYFGVPVIGSDVGGIALQIEDGKTGLLFEVGNVDELGLQLNKLLSDKKLREKLGRNAQAKAEADGDFTRIVEEQILPIYKKFLNKP